MEIKKYHFEHLITAEVTDWERIVKRIKASKHDIEAKDMKS